MKIYKIVIVIPLLICFISIGWSQGMHNLQEQSFKLYVIDTLKHTVNVRKNQEEFAPGRKLLADYEFSVNSSLELQILSSNGSAMTNVNKIRIKDYESKDNEYQIMLIEFTDDKNKTYISAKYNVLDRIAIHSMMMWYRFGVNN